MNLKSIFIVLLAALLALASCDGEMDAPQGPDVPSGGGSSSSSSFDHFQQKYSEGNAAEYGVFIVSIRLKGQAIEPKYMEEYEAEYNKISDSYYEKQWALDDQREAGTITVEEYYEELYRLQNERYTAQFELEIKWEKFNVWGPYTANVRIQNQSDKERYFQYVIWAGNYLTGEGQCYLSEPVTLPANSDAAYIFEVDSGGKYLGTCWSGYNVY